MERREFIRKGCLMCGGAIVLPTLLQNCVSLPVIRKNATGGVITVPVSELKTDQSMYMVRNPKMDFDILLVRHPDGAYKAFYMQCTHYSQPLAANSKQIFCPAHGSTFDFNGNVTREPATQPLRQFPVRADNNEILIQLSS